MLILNAQDVQKAFPMDVAIQTMKDAFAAHVAGKTIVPDRIHIDITENPGVCLVMPAYVNNGHGEALGLKVCSLFEGNRDRGLARLQAGVITLEPDTGRIKAMLEGAMLTAIRTGAASGAASDFMARQDSKTVAVFGAGVQARTQLEAICTVRKIETVWVFDPFPEMVEDMIKSIAGTGPIPFDMRAASCSREALAEADIVCAASTSSTPIFSHDELKPGVHVNACGSYQPDVVEIPADTVAASLLVVDDKHSALEETGDLIQPIKAGIITEDHIHAELGELALGQKVGRNSPEEITFFKSVGLAVQDVASAAVALANAKILGLGQKVDF
jgi:ornithine cyclodeaminase/alanine dehydrogenase-like protein (mu-crystallin family)